MRRFALHLLIALPVLAMSGSATAAIIDDFNDNATSSMWSVVQDDPSKLWVDEANGRLELRSAGSGSPSNDALYLSNGVTGFMLKTDANFRIDIDFSFTGYSGTGLIALDLGIGRDLAGTDSAAIAFARSSSLPGFGALGAAYRVNDVQTEVLITATSVLTGSFIITYDSSADELKLGLDDGNPAHAITLSNMVQGQWSASTVWVSFGGRGNGLTLGGGDAYLDNLVVTGDSIPVPEPASASLLLLGAVGLLRNRKK